MPDPTLAVSFPPGRYGRRRDPARARRRWVAYVLAVAVMVLGVAIAVKLYRQYAQAPYEVRMISVTDITERGVTVTFEVRHPAGEAALCTVVAHSREGEQVGLASVPVAADPDQTVSRITYSLVTTKRPVTGEVPGCGPAPS